MKCALCQKPLTDDERSRASTVLPVLCDACEREYLTNKLAAEDLLQEPGFREAAQKLCAAAAIHGPVVLRFKNGRFYRIEKPIE